MMQCLHIGAKLISKDGKLSLYCQLCDYQLDSNSDGVYVPTRFIFNVSRFGIVGMGEATILNASMQGTQGGLYRIPHEGEK